MIIMINGTFGVGKSSVAAELCAAVANSMIYDPEVMGLALRYLTEGVRTPEEDTDDFQDIALWPGMTVLMAERLYRQYGRTLIVPMTLANRRYLDTIRNGLAAITSPLYHFCLVASLETIEQRLQNRDQDTSWTMRKGRQYAPLFNDPIYGKHIDAENQTVREIVGQMQSYIASNAGISLP